MIRQIYVMTRSDGIDLYRTYSDSNKYILQLETNIEYPEAIDVYPVKYTYVETDKEISTEESCVES